MTIHEAGRQLSTQLLLLYDEREAANIAGWVMERITGFTKIDRVINKAFPLNPKQQRLLKTYTTDLMNHKPVQYVLNEAWFYGMKLYVDENVLIPRPETEELADWIVKEVDSSRVTDGHPQVLDIGTGSGCIALALKKGLPRANVYGCDISAGALAVARRNAGAQQLDIHFRQLDFLSATARVELPAVDVLVSNPPYIPVKDKATMAANVLNHEPHLALFVTNNDPLQYYKAIAAFAKERLRPGGSIYLEIYEESGNTVLDLFRQNGFEHTMLKKDLQGRNRMVKASL
jgi:release factor glutamine methyltransferase